MCIFESFKSFSHRQWNLVKFVRVLFKECLRFTERDVLKHDFSSFVQVNLVVRYKLFRLLNLNAGGLVGNVCSELFLINNIKPVLVFFIQILGASWVTHENFKMYKFVRSSVCIFGFPLRLLQRKVLQVSKVYIIYLVKKIVYLTVTFVQHFWRLYRSLNVNQAQAFLYVYFMSFLRLFQGLFFRRVGLLTGLCFFHAF